MTNLTYPPELRDRGVQGTYDRTPNSGLLRQENELGLARSRSRLTVEYPELKQSFEYSTEDYAIFEDFYFETLQNGTQWFKIELFSGAYGTEFSVRFKVPYQVSYPDNNTVLVSCTFDVRLLQELDKAAQWFLSTYSEEFLTEISDPLDVIVNTTYPGITTDFIG